LIDGKPGVGDDAAESACPDLLVVRNNHPGMRIIATQDHVTA
jgi:hypothetical protein